MPDTALTHTFTAQGDFAAVGAAEDALDAAGFSVGSMQAGAPRGILYGQGFAIAKWRHLDSAARAQLHGIMEGGRAGPVTVTLYHEAPTIARRRFAEIVAAQQAEAA